MNKLLCIIIQFAKQFGAIKNSKAAWLYNQLNIVQRLYKLKGV